MLDLINIPSNLEQNIILSSEQDSKKIAVNLAHNLRGNEIITFKGGLGAGKTFFARQIIQFFCGSEINVTSPTFSIVQIYQAKNFDIYHYDLYRLKDKNELYELALEEAMTNNLCLIEWPEIAADLLKSPIIEIALKLNLTDLNTRHCSINII